MEVPQKTKNRITVWSSNSTLRHQSVQFSRSLVSNSLQPHGLQHARPPCPSPTPGVYSNSCPLSRWCHLTISFSVVPFSSCFQSFPASGSFPMSQFFTSGGQSIGASASASVLSMNIQDRFPLGLTGWTSLQSKGLSRVFSNTTVQKHQFFSTQPNIGMYPDKTRIQKDTCILMFIAALFTIARTWRKPKWPSTDEWIKKILYIYTMEYYSAIKKWNNAICSNMNEPRDDQTKQSQSVKREDKFHVTLLLCGI